MRVTRRVGWRNGCGGPAWHWPDASPGMTLAGPCGRHRGRCVVTGPTPCCLTPWCQRRSDGSTILGSPVVCLSILYQYHAPHKTAACGDRTHDRTPTKRMLHQLSYGGNCGSPWVDPIKYVEFQAASHHVTMASESPDVACPSSIMPQSGHPSSAYAHTVYGYPFRSVLTNDLVSADMRTPSFATPCLVQFVLYIYMTKSTSIGHMVWWHHISFACGVPWVQIPVCPCYCASMIRNDGSPDY